MKTLNVVARTATYNRATTNNSTTVALVGLEEVIRLEQQYPSREFLSDAQRAKAVFEVMMQSARAGAYQVFIQQGLIKRISLHSLSATSKQHSLTLQMVLGRVVVTHTLPNEFSLTKVGYIQLIASLEAIIDADRNASLVEVEEPQAKAGTITKESIQAAKDKTNAA